MFEIYLLNNVYIIDKLFREIDRQFIFPSTLLKLRCKKTQLNAHIAIRNVFQLLLMILEHQRITIFSFFRLLWGKQ